MSTAVLQDLPLPARLAPWPRARRTTLVRCLWLAGLLHLWLILWLGSAPEGTAPPGQGVQGRLNVTLRGPSEDGAPSAPPPQAGQPAAAEAPPRLGGRVRDTLPPADAGPGAERLGPALLAPPAPLPMAAPLPAREALVSPLTPPPLPLPTPAPLPPPLPAESRLDPGALRALQPSAAAPLMPVSPAAAPSLPSALPSVGAALPAPVPAPAEPAVRAEPVEAPRATSASTNSARTEPGARVTETPVSAEAGPRLGADIAVPAAAASAPKRLNLELGRLRGGELSRHGSPGVLPVLPRPPETDKLASEIEKAARSDCRKAHAGAGLLAVVPLAIDSLRGAGCKW